VVMVPSAFRSRFLIPFLGLFLLAVATSEAAAQPLRYERRVERYPMPDVTLMDQRGKPVRLLTLVNADKPVLVNFIYTTCATIGPVLSAGFSNLQKKLGPRAQSVHLISFTIDPEHDTPELMSEYLRRYGAQPGWDFLTGSRDDIDRTMRAFDAYVENKVSHYPITFLKAAGSHDWVRLYGLLSTSELLAEVRKIGVAP